MSVGLLGVSEELSGVLRCVGEFGVCRGVSGVLRELWSVICKYKTIQAERNVLINNPQLYLDLVHFSISPVQFPCSVIQR